MIERIRKMFAAAGMAAPAPSLAAGVEEKQIAAAALLAEAALSDNRFDEAERAAVERLLSEHFGLDLGDARALVERGARLAADSTQLLRFTRAVKDNFSPEERIELIEMIWEVVYADGVLHDYEDSLLRRIAGLIYVSDRDRGAARKRVLDRLRRDGKSV